MAIGLDDALLGWLVASVGDTVARRLRGDPARRALGQIVERAVEVTVAEVGDHLDGHTAEHLRSSLLIHDASPNVDWVPATSEAELRHALYIWIGALDHPEFGEPGYLSGLGVDAQLLADALTSQIAAGIYRNGRGGGALDGLAAWLWRDGVTDHLARLEQKLDATAGTAEPLGGGLPGGTPDFTGRQQALDELAERVRAHDPAGTVVAIHAVDGMAGVGKTELALRAAHQHKHRYPNGQYFINLHGYTEGIPPVPPAAALEELLRQAGVPGEAIPPELAARQARWQALMAARRALVLLDNALDADQVRPLLPNASGCLVLITSRTRLAGLPGARAFPLDVLPPAEAVELFTRLVDVDRQLDPQAVTRIVDLVGRLPVAVHAVAGQVDDTYPEADLADELAEAKASVGLVDQQSPLGAGVRAAFETSLRRLDPGHQRAFRVLSVHPGPTIGVPQFAALAGLPITSARSTLRGLADRNLVTPAHDLVGHRRYDLHDLLREFAHTQAASHLSVEERSAAIIRLTSWYTAAMTAIARLRNNPSSNPTGPKVEGLDLDGPGTAHLWMVTEQDNLLAFAKVATGEPAADLCQRAAQNLYDYDYYASARVLHNTAASLYQQAGNRLGVAHAQWCLGEVARLAGDYRAAAEHYQAAQTTYQQLSDRVGEADVRRGLGDIARQTGDHPAAAEHYQAAQTTYAQTGNRRWEAYVRRGLGDIARHTGDYSTAAEHYRAAQTTYQLLSDRAGEAYARRGLGEVARLTGDYSTAVEHYHAAYTTFAQVGNRRREAYAQLGLGDVALATDDSSTAAEHYHAAQTTHAQTGNREGAAESLCGLGHVAKAQSRRADARERWTKALRLYEEMGSPSAVSVRDLLDRLEAE